MFGVPLAQPGDLIETTLDPDQRRPNGILDFGGLGALGHRPVHLGLHRSVRSLRHIPIGTRTIFADRLDDLDHRWTRPSLDNLGRIPIRNVEGRLQRPDRLGSRIGPVGRPQVSLSRGAVDAIDDVSRGLASRILALMPGPVLCHGRTIVEEPAGPVW